MHDPHAERTPRHYLCFSDLNRSEYDYLMRRAALIKRKFKNYEPHLTLTDRTLAMIFEKASTRTRLSFEAGMHQMGGYAIFINTRDSQLGRGEPVEDAARVFSRMVDVVMIRTFGQDIIERFARYSRVPVINGLTNEFHPCQVLADIFTYLELRGDIAGRTVAWIGDANNMLYTWVQAANVLGFRVHCAAPAGYRVEAARLSQAERTHLVEFDDPMQAAQGADLICTDVWTSMGYEAENAARLKAFQGYMVTPAMMNHAHPDALFMHCLPAHRGEEVDAAVIDGARSVVWQEAENRLHVQKALLEFLLLGQLEA